MLTLGIMSGTSIDSVDYALCSIRRGSVQLLERWRAQFASGLRQRLHDAARGASSSHQLAQLHHDLGRFYARHAMPVLRKNKPELVGLHGQTIFHNPDLRQPATLQLGEPAYLAERLRVPVVSNFRAADIAAGGQGAPLATIFHQMVFARKGSHVCVNNLGGISNVTSIDWIRGRQPTLAAFDTGPANVLIDMAMRALTREEKQMDRKGAWAARGQACEPLLRQWTKHPYFRKKPPKSTGRELFGEKFWNRVGPQMQQAGLSEFDMLATLTEFTARSLVLNYQLHLRSWPQLVILTGGGAANSALVRSIEGAIHQVEPSTTLITSEELGWPVQSIEPAAFALLAWLRVHSCPGNIPQTTGALRAVRLGQVTEP